MTHLQQARRLVVRRRVIAGAVGVAVAGLIVSPSGAAPTLPSERVEPEVTICHATDSDTNPYVRITVDESAVDGVGAADHFGTHTGPIWDSTLKAQHISWGDLIPPVAPYHAGLNWTTAGQAIWTNGCTIAPTTTVAPT
ncbi:MAG: hypothetical protein WD691_08085, partial [Acidimicrobiales bacterium]